MKPFISLLFLAYSLPLFAQWTVETVPSPKSATQNKWVSNPDAIISAGAEAILEDKLNTIEHLTGAEVTVVMLNGIGAEVPADFATKLFNKWGVGKKENNNGVLVLMVKDQRRIEFRTGYGMEATLPDALCYDIQQKYIVPKFKNGDFDGGMIAGLDAVARTIIGEKWDETPTINEEAAFEALAANLPKSLKKGEWVAAENALLSDSAKLALNQKVAKEIDSFGIQLRIVAFNSLGELSRAKAATLLRAKWQIEDSLIDNHIFILLDIAARKSYVYYDLLEGKVLRDEQLLRWVLISNEQVMTSLSQAAAVAAINNSIDVLVRLQRDATYRDSARAVVIAQTVPEPTPVPVNYKEYEGGGGSFWWTVFIWYLWCLGALLTFSVLFVGIAQTLPDPYKKYHILTFFALDIWMYLFPIPFIGVGILLDKLRKHYRTQPRKDPKTGQMMEMLSEKEEDKYLKAGEITEEQIKSISYDVWATQDRKELLILPYKTLFSQYSRCPKCKFRTYYLVYNRTITSATEYSSGTGEKKHACKHCNHSRTTQYTIPRIQSSSSSSGGSSYGGSSGGSFGGGSSGGGGAGSSW